MNSVKKLLINLYGNLEYRAKFFKQRSFKILSATKTIDYLVEKRCSLCRFGDGEFKLVLNYADKTRSKQGIGFQEYNDSIGLRLYEILSGCSDDYMIGLPMPIFGKNLRGMTPFARQYWKNQSIKYIDWLHQKVCRSQLFLDSFFTRFYMDYENHGNCIEYVENLKRIWDNRKLLIVEGAYTRLGIGNNLFQNAECIKRIICPSTNAYEKIDEIKDAIKVQSEDDVLVLVALGPTATVIAADMSSIGIQSIDIGHIDIEYEWMLRNATSKISIPGKYVNEARSTDAFIPIHSQEYDSQIVRVI